MVCVMWDRSFFIVMTFANIGHVTGSFTDPSRDVEPNPSCDPSSVTPSIKDPADVSQLHPAHVKYSFAIGDSISAAALAGDLPLEFRQLSWSGGSGSATSVTMPYFLKQYSSGLVGPSVGLAQIPQLAPCCGKSPWWWGISAWDDQLNAALSGASSSDWKLEVQHVTDLVTGKGFGINHLGGFPKWTQAQKDDFRNSWKVLTIFLGMNDVLTTRSSCSENTTERSAIANRFNSTMTALFDHLVTDPDGIFKKLYINLGTLFSISHMSIENSKLTYCHQLADRILNAEFPCMRQGGDIVAEGERVDDVTRQMNKVLMELAAKYDMKRPDFGVNLFRIPENQQVTHEDLRSPLDCFHPTAKAHRLLGVALWNSMLNRSRPSGFDEAPKSPECATADTVFVTYSRPAKLADMAATAEELTADTADLSSERVEILDVAVSV
eukprot:TRINITY_DN14172_c0_g1_i3.p1 TRINITY_DN14172_c0_g1~~TRINITY_DN14172_c0_g1_i3.p1  ORF type:complete len:437 (+),score=57.35 TRINITY_DN14172_c0_g1_i3:105-1415(+)